MSWTNLTRLAPPDDTPISLAEAKAHLSVFHTDEDALIASLIDAATSFVEGPNGIGVALLDQTWRLSLDGFPTGPMTIPLGPVKAITSITYRDGAGVFQTVDPDLYDTDLDASPCRIWRAPSASWPSLTLRPGSVKVTFTAGSGIDPEEVPAAIRHAIKLLIGHFYEHRGDTNEEIPGGVHALLSRYRAGL